jgi:hypothetical protein
MPADDLKALAQPRRGERARAEQAQRSGAGHEAWAGLAALEARPHAFSLFAALRLLEKSCAQ